MYQRLFGLGYNHAVFGIVIVFECCILGQYIVKCVSTQLRKEYY